MIGEILGNKGSRVTKSDRLLAQLLMLRRPSFINNFGPEICSRRVWCGVGLHAWESTPACVDWKLYDVTRTSPKDVAMSSRRFDDQ